MRTDSQDAVLQAKVKDAIYSAQSGRDAHFIGFLDERQAVLVRQTAKQARFTRYLLWGGYTQAERVCFGAFPAWEEPNTVSFPIHAVTAAFRPCDQLSHRDFLGALTGAGVSREVLGDVLLQEGRCVFFCRSEIMDFLLTQMTKVGRVGVHLSPDAQEPLPPAHRYRPFSTVISSPRLDCVAAACTGLSRAKAQELLKKECVQVNHLLATDADVSVKEGDLLSIRGRGRYRIDTFSQPTHKGRLRLQGRKFI
ncbi:MULTISPECIES: RNA-binding protein [Caproicibacterium]|jgi:RNA-binding protein YlmH|uniref:RNA-binding S4 domain-containing protein n=1 Tax=Caproicibacterium lactatifermentans TaxID=2666138 RepID=A0A859DQM6_9FIRM|nr:YlmH/Sll1252 family protein [Caproicibacterium lactatifermentans]ARP50177.1 hypothetical protein B6259_04350 [Ruminococcaceae bacterium CPB6]MDD4807947.1 YlmH/Sll1252 family protein [Oscillospiraceae bacterium]QKN24100.1 hypothetical protein GJQ69_06165 [Caproicibacterium lactatifermentans]QKO30832.1 hypothetical protein GKP14_07370 [Caproicibacterium lactatifermentans]